MDWLFFISVIVAILATWYFFKKAEVKGDALEPFALKVEETIKEVEKKLDEEYLPKPKKKSKKNG